MSKGRSLSLLQRYFYYPLCGVLVVVLALAILFVLKHRQIGETLFQRGLTHYRQAEYEPALKRFLLALQLDRNHKQAELYKELCLQHLSPNPDVAKVQEYLQSDNPEVQHLGLELAIERNLRGLVADIGPLLRAQDQKVRTTAAIAIRMLRTSKLRVLCSICNRDAVVTVEAGERFPVRCPHCSQIAARPLWQCYKCGHLWVPSGAAAWSCPECGSPNVGGAAIDAQ